MFSLFLVCDSFIFFILLYVFRLSMYEWFLIFLWVESCLEIFMMGVSIFILDYILFELFFFVFLFLGFLIIYLVEDFNFVFFLFFWNYCMVGGL